MQLSLDDGIAAVRATLPHCEFDSGACAEGVKALKAYRKEWDEERGCWRDKPRHDWASHGADAFRVLATRFRHVEPVPVSKPKSDTIHLLADEHGRVRYVRDGGDGQEETVTLQDVVWAHVRRRKREREDGRRR
jgi:hypothetical protein